MPPAQKRKRFGRHFSHCGLRRHGSCRCRVGEHLVANFLKGRTNQRLRLSFASKTQLLTRGIQRRPKKSETPLKARIIRVRRKKAVETLMQTEKRDDRVSTALDEFFPQTFSSKNQQNGKTKLSGQDRLLLDVLFPRSLFSENQYTKTKLSNQPE